MSSPFALSEEQLAVVSAAAPRFTVVAAAGAGKTSVLVERYLRHVLEDGLRPDDILTITFTKKAAAQMKERIVRRLNELGRTADAQVAETGPIQTIHSFCERLLRENSLEAGLDPGFEILSESHASRMAAACIREALASPLDEEPQAEELISYLAGKRPAFGENKSPYGILESAVGKVLSEIRGCGVTFEVFCDRHRSPSILRLAWESILLSEVPEEAREAFDQAIGASFAERLRSAVKAAGVRMPAWLKGGLDPSAEEEALRHTCGVAQLAAAAWWRLDRDMQRAQALDFTALEERAVRLLARSEVTRRRLREQVKVVMVDEAQDLNPMQYTLLRHLDVAQEMLVGDHQQSIYGFRQADVEIFNRRASSSEALRLSRNFRSTPGILRFVDFVFGRQWDGYVAMSEVTGPMDFDADGGRDFSGVEIWRQPKDDYPGVASYVAELLVEGVPPKEIAVLVRDSIGAQAVEHALRTAGIPARVAGGTERFYTRLEVRDLANALRAVADPYDDFSLLACLHSPVVGLSLDTVFLLGREANVVERLASFEPPVQEDAARLNGFLEWYEPLRKIADRLAAWEVLAEIFARSRLIESLARRDKPEQLLANVRKLLSLAAQEPDLGPLDYAERIREIQDLRHKEGDAPADADDADIVTIMTIHKAKGLEFPVVVLPQTNKRLAATAKELVVEPRLGLVATKFGKLPSLMHRFLTERRKERDEREEFRVLYVALTRAKSRLCVCLYPVGRDRSVSRVLSDLIGDAVPPGVVVRDSRMTPRDGDRAIGR